MPGHYVTLTKAGKLPFQSQAQKETLLGDTQATRESQGSTQWKEHSGASLPSTKHEILPFVVCLPLCLLRGVVWSLASYVLVPIKWHSGISSFLSLFHFALLLRVTRWCKYCEFPKHVGSFSVYVMGHAQILMGRA